MPGSRFRLLVVDDDASARNALCQFLTELGYDCHTAADGKEAFDAHGARAFDLILSDWNMPGCDGMELCTAVRAGDGRDRYTYFVLMTARPNRRHLVAGLRHGADDFITKPIDLDELEARLLAAQRVIRLQRSLTAKNRSLRRDSERFFRQARLDPLTSLPNRLELDEDLPRLVTKASGAPGSACIAMCDVDHFKMYNDTFGHLEGDEVLRKVAATIRRSLRQSDSVYRYGGEEFVVLLPEQNMSEASAAMERVRKAVEALGLPNPASGSDRLTISIGIAPSFTKDDPAAWLARADHALYEAKSSGRNRVSLWTPPKPALWAS